MKVTRTRLEEVLLVEPVAFGDERGWFYEIWRDDRYAQAGITGPFVQDNLSRSHYGILRGLHLQHPHGQGKLVGCLEGEVFDVAVDVRVGSPRFGQWVGAVLSAENHRQMWIPPGFAHGYCVTSEHALFHYKCTEAYHPESEMSVLWNDPAIAVEWPVPNPVVGDKDRKGQTLLALTPRLPKFEA